MGKVIILGVMLCGFGTINSQPSQTMNMVTSEVLLSEAENSKVIKVQSNAASDDDCDDVI